MRDETGISHGASSGNAFPAELMLWLSPSFPIGGFAYSQGLETAVARGLITGREELRCWLLALLTRGMLWSDLVVLSLTYRAASESKVRELADLALALQPSAERADELVVLGRNFREALLAGWPELAPRFDRLENGTAPYPIGIALAARAHGLALADTLAAYAHAFVSNALSAAIRLAVIGQFDGQRIHRDLFPIVRGRVAAAEVATEDDIATAQFVVDIQSMNHETQRVRLFRS